MGSHTHLKVGRTVPLKPADSSNHTKHAYTVIATAKNVKAPKFLVSKSETVDLVINIQFLATNGFSANNGAVLHSLTDFQLAITMTGKWK